MFKRESLKTLTKIARNIGVIVAGNEISGYLNERRLPTDNQSKPALDDAKEFSKVESAANDSDYTATPRLTRNR